MRLLCLVLFVNLVVANPNRYTNCNAMPSGNVMGEAVVTGSVSAQPASPHSLLPTPVPVRRGLPETSHRRMSLRILCLALVADLVVANPQMYTNCNAMPSGRVMGAEVMAGTVIGPPASWMSAMCT